MARLKDYKVFAISKCRVYNPLIPEWSCTEYTRHTITWYNQDGVRVPRLTDLVITAEKAQELIAKHKMRVALSSPYGVVWDTTPSLKDECRRLGITYSEHFRHN